MAAVAAALRWFRIDAQSLWYDEGISAHQLTRSFPEIARAAALDTHPPLYYWTLKAWGETLGSSEFRLRSLSAATGMLAVVLTWLIGRRLFGTLVGTLAALLLAAAPLAVYYSQEVRMYAQVTMLALLAVYAYVRRWPWLYALAGLATLYTQYLGAAVVIALNVHALLWWRTQTRREWLTWLGANATVVAGFLPWLPTFVAQQSHALNTSPRTATGLGLDTLSAYGGGIAHGDLFIATGGVLIVLAVLGWLLWRDKHAASLALLVWLAPLALVLTLGLRSGLFEVRYLVLSLPGLALLAAAGMVRLGRHPTAAVGLGLAALVPAAYALSAQYFDPALARDDYRGLVRAIEADAQPTDVVVLSAPNQAEIFDYYYRGPLAAVGLPNQRPIDPRDTVQRLDEIKAQYGRMWLVSWAMNEADPPGVIASWLAANGFQASHQWYGSVQLALVGFGPANTPTQRVDTPLDNGIVLEGYRLGSESLKPGQTLALTLLWRADGGPTADHWKVFTHLLDGASRVVAQRDAEPADNLRPTTSWQSGEHIEDNYGISVPDNLPDGSYTLEIGMYAGEKRSLFNGLGDHLELAQVEVHP
ncbi:MAG: glycosyltransferase family 39 protein [Chloroflexi bacterium]|nr:glycosyltransferase family 39 protein [Chloroflexota bacterium]